MTLALAHSRGWLDYEERVCSYWPEFAQNGKESITVRQLLAHQAGLFAFDGQGDRSLVADLDRLAVVLARQKPAWEPGTRQAIMRSPSATTRASCCAASIRSTAAWGNSFRMRSPPRWDSISTFACPSPFRIPGWRHWRGPACSRYCAGSASASF